MTPALPLPALHASHGGCWLRDGGGNTRGVGKGEAIVAAAPTVYDPLNHPFILGIAEVQVDADTALAELAAIVDAKTSLVYVLENENFSLCLQLPLCMKRII